MRQLRMARLLTAAALVVPAAMATWVVAGPASAGAPATCAVLNATVKGTGTVSKCTDPANTGGSGKIVFNIVKLTGTVTWSKTGTSTMKIAYKTQKPDEKETKVCPKGTTEVNVTGSITGGTGAAIKSIPKGQKVSAEICFSKTTVTLEPGTVFTF